MTDWVNQYKDGYLAALDDTLEAVDTELAALSENIESVEGFARYTAVLAVYQGIFDAAERIRSLHDRRT